MNQSPGATVLAASNLVLDCSVSGDLERLRLDHRGLRLLSEAMTEAARDMRSAAEAGVDVLDPQWHPAWSTMHALAEHVLHPPT